MVADDMRIKLITTKVLLPSPTSAAPVAPVSSTSSGSESPPQQTESPSPQQAHNPASPNDALADITRNLCVLEKHPTLGFVLRVTCRDGSVLGVTEVHPPGKNPMGVRDFWNGLRGNQLYWASPLAGASLSPDAPRS